MSTCSTVRCGRFDVIYSSASVSRYDTSKICANVPATVSVQADKFLFPTSKRSGGPKLKVSSNTAAHLLAHMRSHPEKTLVQALSHLASEFYGSVFNLPHRSTICRTLQRRKFNRKVMERRHINRDPIKRAAFFGSHGPLPTHADC